MSKEKLSLLGMTLDELRAVATALGAPAFVGNQMASWLYGKHVETIDGMGNLKKELRERLKESYVVGRQAAAMMQQSADGTVKYLFPATMAGEGRGGADGRYVETVMIPDGDRATLCVSCQVGCRMGCVFCQTGRQGFQGNLDAAAILNQVAGVAESDRLTNIVFMGQGEPMDNLDNVLRATDVLTAPWGYGWSPRRITVSSVGVKEKLKRFLDESECHVAISLHSPLPPQRLALMPAERAMGIEEVVELLRQYDFAHQRRLSFEYIVFGGVNDSPAHARAVARLLRGLDCRVNLIRFHDIPGTDLHGADEATMLRLRDFLTRSGVFTTIRASRGQDIDAACGLLNTKSLALKDK